MWTGLMGSATKMCKFISRVELLDQRVMLATPPFVFDVGFFPCFFFPFPCPQSCSVVRQLQLGVQVVEQKQTSQYEKVFGPRTLVKNKYRSHILCCVIVTKCFSLALICALFVLLPINTR